MKMSKWFLAASAALAVAVLAGCATAAKGGGASEPEPPPPGTERLTLENGAYAIFRFDLPSGAKWGDYNRLTADYLIDEVNIRKGQRNGNTARLMGNYSEEDFTVTGRRRNFNLGGEGAGNANGPYIMDDTPRKFADIGAVADQWFTVEYVLSGATAHNQFDKKNIPSPDAAGPFFFGLGMPGHGEGGRAGITQLIRDVTLHHASDPSLNVVSTGSGFEEPTFVSFVPVQSTRSGQ